MAKNVRKSKDNGNRRQSGAARRGRGGDAAAPRVPLSEVAYRQIKERLIGARYQPGQFLQEASICEELSVGRTPVHQALHRLHQEGLVEVIPRKGILVKTDSLSEILLALEVRTLVEPYCAAHAATKITDEDLAELRKILNSYKKSETRKLELMELDRRFHIKIALIAGNQLLVDFLRPVHERMSRIWFLPHWQYRDFGRTDGEHEGLYEAFARHDAATASKAMLTHLESLRQSILAVDA